MSYSTEQTYLVVANPRTGTTHLAHAIEHARHCRHEGPLAFSTECKGFLKPEEVEWGEATEGQIVTCKRCRTRARDSILSDVQFDREANARAYEREAHRLDDVEAFIKQALGAAGRAEKEEEGT